MQCKEIKCNIAWLATNETFNITNNSTSRDAAHWTENLILDAKKSNRKTEKKFSFGACNCQHKIRENSENIDSFNVYLVVDKN